jgi:hypothetical protein
VKSRQHPLCECSTVPDVARPVPDSRFLQLAFTRRIRRTPRRSDATVVVDGIRYELPARFAHLPSVILRAPSWDKSQMTLVDPNTDAPLVRLLPQDKVKNASGMRRAINPKNRSNQTTIPCRPCCESGLPIMPLRDCRRLIYQRRKSTMNNTDIRSLYGLKYNPFLPDVPPESLFKYPEPNNFFSACKPWPHREDLP